jgi:Na+-translocating ferredoxin:NAD+ oxidoreductase subunit B
MEPPSCEPDQRDAGQRIVGGDARSRVLAHPAGSFRVTAHSLAERIDALMPQTQCTRCGYPGCRPYAEAIVRGDADINHCPPGGEDGVRALADLLGREPKPIDPARGSSKPNSVALIEESECIGCTLCIQACPVDAVVGAPKLMHTVITSECTGCELCVPPCPVDCILMVLAPETPLTSDSPSPAALARRKADQARGRFEARKARKAVEDRQRAEDGLRRKAALTRPGAAEIAQAIERAKARKRAVNGSTQPMPEAADPANPDAVSLSERP